MISRRFSRSRRRTLRSVSRCTSVGKLRMQEQINAFVRPCWDGRPVCRRLSAAGWGWRLSQSSAVMDESARVEIMARVARCSSCFIRCFFFAPIDQLPIMCSKMLAAVRDSYGSSFAQRRSEISAERRSSPALPERISWSFPGLQVRIDIMYIKTAMIYKGRLLRTGKSGLKRQATERHRYLSRRDLRKSGGILVVPNVIIREEFNKFGKSYNII